MKKVTMAVLALSLGFSFAANAKDSVTPPIGLKWNDSEEKLIKDYGGKLNENVDGRLKTYYLSAPPSLTTGFDTYYAIIDNKHGLVSVSAVKHIKGDINGTRGIELYKKYKELITAEYGAARYRIEFTGRKEFKKPDEFYLCLKHAWCGSYAAYYGSEDRGDVIVRLIGEQAGEGYISVNYNSPYLDSSYNEAGFDTDGE